MIQHLLDLWIFDIHEVKARNISRSNEGALIVPLKQDLNMREMLLWFKEAVDQHYENQEKMMTSIEKVRNTTLCLNCSLPNTLCECLETQSAVTSLDDTLGIFLKLLLIIQLITMLAKQYLPIYYLYNSYWYIKCSMNNLKNLLLDHQN